MASKEKPGQRETETLLIAVKIDVIKTNYVKDKTREKGVGYGMIEMK